MFLRNVDNLKKRDYICLKRRTYVLLVTTIVEHEYGTPLESLVPYPVTLILDLTSISLCESVSNYPFFSFDATAPNLGLGLPP
jgi:hypothetical protein